VVGARPDLLRCYYLRAYVYDFILKFAPEQNRADIDRAMHGEDVF